MNPELAPETTGKAENFSIRFLKWAVGTILSFEILGVIFWLLFYSVYLANLPFIIPLRNWYQETYWRTEGLLLTPKQTYPPFVPVYTIHVYNKSQNSGYYTYALWGKFFGFDIEKKTIYLRGYDSNIYTFNLLYALDINKFITNLNDKGILLPIFVFKNYNPFGSKTVSEASIIDILDPSITNEKVFQVRWESEKSLYQVQKDYSKNPSIPLNSPESKFMLTTFD